jgi:hypothetical protein
VSRQLNEPLVSQFSRIFENYRLHSDHTIYTDSGAHNFFQFMRALDPWVRGREFLGLITCRELCVQVAEVFQVKKVVWHQIPPDFLTSQQIAAPPHFPDVYEKLRSEIDPPFKGALYLVGAGAFGKVYCDWIKQRGGIGIDIGSVFDGWAGVRVRQRLELRKDLYSLERYRVPLERSARLAEFREVMQRNLRDVVAPDELQFLIAEARGVASGHPGT